MKTVLLLVGKTQNKIFRSGIDDYVSRIGHYMPFNVTTIPELKNTKSLSEDQQRQKEGELILKEIQTSDTVVLLDERGKEFRSVEFAEWLRRKQNTSRRLLFLIGGPYGFSPDVYARANDSVSSLPNSFTVPARSLKENPITMSEKSADPVQIPSSAVRHMVFRHGLPVWLPLWEIKKGGNRKH